MLIALSGAVLSAAQSTAQAPVSPPGQPARDRPGVTSPVERGVIRGRVTDFATGEGVPRALVQISGATTLATFTDPDGSFELRELAAGQYTIYASRRGYLDDDPIRRATSPIEVAPNGGRAEVNIPLMRAGVIGGQVTDEFGEPVAGVQVRVGRSFYVNGRRQLLSMAHMGLEHQTDDEGRFRVGNLRPGRYFVWTQPFSDVPDEGLVGEAPQSYLKTFAPGVRDVDSASAIELGPGDRNLAVNVALTRGRSVNVSVMATGADGAPLANVVVSLDTFELGFGFSSFGSGNSAKMTDKQGHFAIPNVAPGQYALSVRSVQGRGQLYARFPFEVRDTDITGVVVRPNITTITVRGVNEDKSAIGASGRVPVQLVAEASALDQIDTEPQPNGTLAMQVPSGRYWVKALDPSIAIRQVLVNGMDITDAPLEVRDDAQEAEVTVVITTHPSRIGGTVVDDAGKPANGVLVIAFSTTPERWRQPATRYVVAGRTDGNGAFSVGGLPGGDYYVGVATDVEPNPLLELYGIDPEILERMRTSATVVTVGDGQTARVSLRAKPQ